jgi:uncharacterized protein YlxW (UPF0749 family)
VSDAQSPPAAPVVKSRPKFGRTNIWKILVLLAAATMSFLAVGQLSEEDNFEEQLQTESEGDLARILSSLSSESTALQEELATLKVQLATLQNNSNAQGTVSAQVQAQLNSLEVLAGTVPVAGPGLEIGITDSASQVTYEVLVDAVQELRDAGAEAIAINGRRVGVASAFTTRDGRILLDDIPLPTPYDIDAIGPAATMEGGLNIPGGAIDTLQALNGVRVDVRRQNSLALPALAEPPSFSSARPVG